jgi:5'/3'-nucleotidase SurE
VEAILEHTNWSLSIVVPHTQRSWIGKAHFAGRDLSATFIYPNSEGENTYLGPFDEPQSELRSKYQEWALIDGTPASCADIGVHHLYNEKGPVDLVISGPNFGRNTTAVYSTSSGTVGAAMEGALSNIPAVALSYAFETREMTPEQKVVVDEASLIAVKLIEYLYNNWNKDVDLYAVNIPLNPKLKFGVTKIEYAPIFENRWSSLFHMEERQSREEDIVDGTESKFVFKWRPDFHEVHKTIIASEARGEHNDGIVLQRGNVRYVFSLTFVHHIVSTNHKNSVSPLKAIFKSVETSGEIKLE